MKYLSGRQINGIFTVFSKILIELFNTAHSTKNLVLSNETKGKIIDRIKWVNSELKEMNLDTACIQIKKFLERVNDLNAIEIMKEITYIQGALDNELESKESNCVFAFLNNPNTYLSSLIDAKTEKAISQKFPAAIIELDEAAKCYIFERYTSCVFHCMRKCEVGLKSFADELKTPLAKNWGNIIREIENKLKGMQSHPKYSFYCDAAKHFIHLKDAVRNYVTHQAVFYDKKEADSILRNTVMFIEKLTAI